MEYNYAVFIGRFQPIHKAHLQVIRQALGEAKELIMVLGSATSARTIKNPFTYEERVEMIKSCLTPEEQPRVHFIPARDYHYNDNHWLAEVQGRIRNITKGDESVCLVGKYKDSSSFYIKFFPQWDFIPAKSEDMDATLIRFCMFAENPYGHGNIPRVKIMSPEPVGEWIAHTFMQTQTWKDLCEEYAFIEKYKKQWANVPFPVTFNTCDAVVVCSGHVLVVKRKFNPGKGLYALPGGFLKQSETLEAGAIRELKEETGIKVHAPVLKSHIVESKTFDHPGRSLRGRTITTAFYIKLPDGELPEVKGSDDAEVAIWLPLMDALGMEKEFFDDHSHIIRYFLNRS
jgi:bifunctional NMN adenylyltransferase/nudix hydrolase